MNASMILNVSLETRFFHQGPLYRYTCCSESCACRPAFWVVDNYILENDVVPRMSFGSVTNFKEMVLEAHRLLELRVPEEKPTASSKTSESKPLRTTATPAVSSRSSFHIYKTVPSHPASSSPSSNIQTSLFEEAYRTVNLPPTEHPEIPHYVMELARPEFFAFVAPRRHIFNHHLPWAYSKGLGGVGVVGKGRGGCEGEGVMLFC
ncbi:hypothetical protein BC829DRAFT_245116 [Chytridium lagenaria]|nr:hypothetical protein BC829DRAFT_245116 [Chytridium lagenaria]